MVYCEYVKYVAMLLTMVPILNLLFTCQKFQIQIALKFVKPFCTKKIKTKISQSANLIIWSTFQFSDNLSYIFCQNA